MVFISKGFADAHPGEECASAASYSVTDTDLHPSDRGGFVYTDGDRNLTNVRLFGTDDVLDPLNAPESAYTDTGT